MLKSWGGGWESIFCWKRLFWEKTVESVMDIILWCNNNSSLAWGKKEIKHKSISITLTHLIKILIANVVLLRKIWKDLKINFRNYGLWHLFVNLAVLTLPRQFTNFRYFECSVVICSMLFFNVSFFSFVFSIYVSYKIIP